MSQLHTSDPTQVSPDHGHDRWLESSRRTRLMPVIVGAVAAIVLVIGLVVVGRMFVDREFPPEPVPVDNGALQSPKSVQAPLPQEVAGHTRQGQNEHEEVLYRRNQDPLIEVSTRRDRSDPYLWLREAGVERTGEQGHFLCGESGRTTTCVSELSDGVLVVQSDQSDAETGEFANQLLEAM